MSTELEKYQAVVQGIYALENIDITTVRPLGKRKPVQKKEITTSKRQHNRALQPSPQAILDFGLGFREWMVPFVLKEPISVLILSPQAMEALIQQGKKTLEDLLLMEKQGAVAGLGQGHLDEICERLHEYLRGQNPLQTTTLDLPSLLRSSLATMRRDKMYLLLEAEKLTSITTWTDAEKLGSRHLKVQEREELLQSARLECSSLTGIAEAMEVLSKTFVVSWMQRRQDLVTEEEIYERLELVSEDPELHRKSFTFLQRYCFENNFPLKGQLISVEKQLYSSTQDTAMHFYHTKQQMMSYFYASGLTYPLQTLVAYIEKENAKEWKHTPTGWVACVARKSSEFSVRKSQAGELHVSIA